MEKQNRTTDKLTDRTFLRLVTTSILAIVICLVCLCSSTYAWFTTSVPSAGNEFKASGECTLEVTVTPNVTGAAALDNIESGVDLDAGAEYLVVMFLPPHSASGYCVIEAGGNTYYSDYIIGNTDQPQILSFLMKSEKSQVATFTTRWGIYNRDSDVVDGVLTVGSVSGLGENSTPDETS